MATPRSDPGRESPHTRVDLRWHQAPTSLPIDSGIVCPSVVGHSTDPGACPSPVSSTSSAEDPSPIRTVRSESYIPELCGDERRYTTSRPYRLAAGAEQVGGSTPGSGTPVRTISAPLTGNNWRTSAVRAREMSAALTTPPRARHTRTPNSTDVSGDRERERSTRVQSSPGGAQLERLTSAPAVCQSSPSRRGLRRSFGSDTDFEHENIEPVGSDLYPLLPPGLVRTFTSARGRSPTSRSLPSSTLSSPAVCGGGSPYTMFMPQISETSDCCLPPSSTQTSGVSPGRNAELAGETGSSEQSSPTNPQLRSCATGEAAANARERYIARSRAASGASFSPAAGLAPAPVKGYSAPQLGTRISCGGSGAAGSGGGSCSGGSETSERQVEVTPQTMLRRTSTVSSDGSRYTAASSTNSRLTIGSSAGSAQQRRSTAQAEAASSGGGSSPVDCKNTPADATESEIPQQIDEQSEQSEPQHHRTTSSAEVNVGASVGEPAAGARAGARLPPSVRAAAGGQRRQQSASLPCAPHRQDSQTQRTESQSQVQVQRRVPSTGTIDRPWSDAQTMASFEHNLDVSEQEHFLRALAAGRAARSQQQQ